MVSGQLNLFVGLVIIMLAPEVFEPLRQVGAQFHASPNGVAAAEQCFTILETPERESGTARAARAGSSPIRIEGLSVGARGSWAPYSLNGTIQPGKITALAGPSGGGKSTTVQVLLGLEPATRGMIRAESSDGELVSINDFDTSSWYQGISWIPQRPTISPGTVLSNIFPDADTDQIPQTLNRAAHATGFDTVVKSLPDGWQTELGVGGVGLSVGQRQRMALTRTLVSVPTMLILDEPTAHLDAMSEEQIIGVLKELKDHGTTIVVIAHRKALLEISDTVLQVSSHPATEAEIKLYPELLDDYELEDLSGELPSFLDPAALPEDDDQGVALFQEQQEVDR